MSHSIGRLATAIAVYAVLARADCECGYTVASNASTTTPPALYTDLIETNFLYVQNITQNTDWRIQTYASRSQRPLGRNTTRENVIANPLVDNSTHHGPGVLGGPAGLQLWVRGGPPINNYVPSAEIATRRKDLLYGSIRVAARLTPMNGTCSGMYTYFNDTQEIDIELLSRHYAKSVSPSESPLNLVLHSTESLQAGRQDPNTENYGKPVLPVDVTAAFHEYRFDWSPGRVSFFFDGEWVYDLNSDDVPVEGSPFLMNHWSNGAPGWSLGPPEQDAVMTVSYFKAYFNSSNPQRTDDFNGRCMDPSRPGAVCVVPHQVGAPNGTATDASNSTSQSGTAEIALGQSTGAKTFFFSEQNNQTVNQTVYNASAPSSTGGGKPGAGASSTAPALSLISGYTQGWMALFIVVAYLL